ncbi:hypothetical protein LVD15_00990 [Fulvivirga maritima]|uniref:hypothetical protein n=1 Tax=Fulvivirga maritima TaxID=2904247 RepID=UPI001F1DBE9A|nr:hypothetical protein [Fulvivirga maritima]UII27041.1 hypothetical protein LVD15_00990 [Fulvivirga maritima]
MLKVLRHVLLFLLLTVFTQIGGVVYLVTVLIARKLSWSAIKALLLFFGFYILSTLMLVPALAPLFGRVPLPLTGNLRPLNITTCLLNRHYVTPDLKNEILRLSIDMKKEFPDTKTNYLDANFPFFDGFPLLPHWSHNDGRKIDLAFYYSDKSSGRASDNAPSFIGYGIYEAPKNGESNYPEICAEKGFFQYGALTYLVPKWHADDYNVDATRTKRLLQLMAGSDKASKIFIEPHLKERWQLTGYDKVRYHGCHAVRHDDHIHYQIK